MNPCTRADNPTWVPAPTWGLEAVLDFDQVFSMAAAEQRMTMLIVYVEGCRGWMRMVAPLITDEEVIATTRDRFHVYAVNADDDEQLVLIDGRGYSAPQLADMLGVETYPAFVLFEGDGRLLQILEHPDSVQELRLTLEDTITLEYGIARIDGSGTYNATEGDMSTLLERSVEAPPPHVSNLTDGADDRPLAVFFEESDCHHCDHFRQHIISDPQTRSMLEQFRIVRIEIQSTSELVTPDNRQLTVAQWSRELGITSTPTVVLFDEAGRRVGHSSDHTDLFRFQSLLDYVVSDSYQSDPSFAHFLQHRVRHLRSHGYDIDTAVD